MILEENNSRGRLLEILFCTASVQSPCDVAITDYKYSIPSINNYQKRLNSHNSSWKCKFYTIFQKRDFFENFVIFLSRNFLINFRLFYRNYRFLRIFIVLFSLLDHYLCSWQQVLVHQTSEKSLHEHHHNVSILLRVSLKNISSAILTNIVHPEQKIKKMLCNESLINLWKIIRKLMRQPDWESARFSIHQLLTEVHGQTTLENVHWKIYGCKKNCVH